MWGKTGQLERTRLSALVVPQPEDPNTDQVVPTVSKWTTECFPGGSQSTEKDLRDLIIEAADAAKNDFNEESARVWAQGYQFPPE